MQHIRCTLGTPDMPIDEILAHAEAAGHQMPPFVWADFLVDLQTQITLYWPVLVFGIAAAWLLRTLLEAGRAGDQPEIEPARSDVAPFQMPTFSGPAAKGFARERRDVIQFPITPTHDDNTQNRRV